LATSHAKWNVVWHLLDGVFFFAALISFSAEIVIPTMIKELRDSALLLGLVPLVMQAGMVLPQTFYVKMIEGLSYKKPAVLLCAFLQRAGWVVFLLSLYWRWDPAVTLPIFFVVLAVNSLGSGLIMPVWTDWYAKTVPEKLWGRLLGTRHAIPAVLGVALGILIQQVMRAYPAPGRYRILLILTISFYVLSYVCVMLVREDRHEGLPTHDGKSWGSYFMDLAAILRRRRDFLLFLAAAVTISIPTAVTQAFLTKHGLTHPGVTAGITGRFTMLYFGGMAVGSVVGGVMSDRMSTMAPFRMFPAFVVAASAAAALSAEPRVISASWAMLGVGWGIRMAVMLPAVVRFAEPHRRPSYAAVLFTVVGVSTAAVPPLLGLAKDAQLLAFPHLFVLCAAMALVGWLLFLQMPAPQRQS